MLDRLLHPFEFFAQSYLATLLVAAGCAYLGVFIALRRVVFVGIALAELSAAGIAAAFMLGALLPGMGEAELDRLALGGSVLFALAGTLILAAPLAERRVAREGFVAVGYAVGAAAALLLVWKSAHDLEHVKNILAGSSLYVTGAQLATLTAAFAAMALVHAAFRKEFIFCSFDPITARTLGIPARGLDLVLFATIGLGIALALRTLGVLAVFGFLAIPPVAGFLTARRLDTLFVHAVAQALIASAAGLLLADLVDLPPGPATVAVLAALLVPAAIASRSGPFRRAFVVFEVAGTALALVLGGFALHAYIHQHPLGGPVRHAHRELPARVVEAPRERAPSPRTILEHAIEEIESGDEHGIEELVHVLGSDAPPFDRGEALDALRPITGGDMGYDPDLPADAPPNARALERLRDWHRHARGRLKFDRAAKTFRAD